MLKHPVVKLDTSRFTKKRPENNVSEYTDSRKLDFWNENLNWPTRPINPGTDPVHKK